MNLAGRGASVDSRERVADGLRVEPDVVVAANVGETDSPTSIDHRLWGGINFIYIIIQQPET